MFEFWGWEFEIRKKNGKRDNGELVDKKNIFRIWKFFLKMCSMFKIKYIKIISKRGNG